MTSNDPVAARAAARAQWLADLSRTLGEAEGLVLLLAGADGERTELDQLRDRILGLRRTVAQLQLGREPPGGEVSFERLP